MGREHLQLVRDPALPQLRERRVHRLEVRLRADEDPDERARLVQLLEQPDRRSLGLRAQPATFTAFAAMSRSVAHVRERDPLARLVGARPRLLDRVADSGHVEDPATARHELPVPHRGPGVEDDGAVRLGVVDSRDRRARVAALPDRSRPRARPSRRTCRTTASSISREVALRRGAERLGEVAVEPREDRPASRDRRSGS